MGALDHNAVVIGRSLYLANRNYFSLKMATIVVAREYLITINRLST